MWDTLLRGPFQPLQDENGNRKYEQLAIPTPEMIEKLQHTCYTQQTNLGDHQNVRTGVDFGHPGGKSRPLTFQLSPSTPPRTGPRVRAIRTIHETS